MQHINHNEPDVYFYHSDHLGSASWITDASGKPIQHLQYLPFGEPFINQRISSYNERFTFTGKERDEETGYGYFGARYMDHELMTMWLSVDPMADKYPSVSPYAYCAWNPVKLVDPDGREIDGYKGSNGQYVWFADRTEKSFVDGNGVTWDKVTDNRHGWDEATKIREANIQALVCLGFDRKEVEGDVRLYDGDNLLFTKESQLLNPQKYISNWDNAFNSEDKSFTAKQSPTIKNTGFSLKFYSNKGGQKGSNSLGLVKTNVLLHLFEGSIELIESLFPNSTSDPLHDMHYNNASGLLSKLFPSNSSGDITSPPTVYSVYHMTGGPKLP